MHIPLKKWFRKTRQKIFQLLGRVFGKPLDCKCRSLLIIAPHPDDEVFGCGGLIKKTIASNVELHILYMTSGTRSHQNCCDINPQKVGAERKKIAASVARQVGLGAETLHWLDCPNDVIPESSSSDFSDVRDRMSKIISNIKPDTIFCPHPHDSWKDHELTTDIVRAAIPDQKQQIRLFYYCVWFWLNLPLKKGVFLPWKTARYLDIQHVFSDKQKAIEGYLAPFALCGNPYSGRLPEDFLMAFEWKKELYFEAE